MSMTVTMTITMSVTVTMTMTTLYHDVKNSFDSMADRLWAFGDAPTYFSSS